MLIRKLLFIPLMLLLVYPNLVSAETKTIKIAFMGSQSDEDMHGSLVFKDYVEASSNGNIKVRFTTQHNYVQSSLSVSREFKLILFR